MDYKIKKDGLTLYTKDKYCEEDINIIVDTPEEDGLIDRSTVTYFNNGVATVADYAFYNNTTIEKVEFNNVQNIKYAFAGCENLDTIILNTNKTVVFDNSTNKNNNKVLYYSIDRNGGGDTERYSASIHGIKDCLQFTVMLGLYDRIVFNYGGETDSYLSRDNTVFEGDYIDSEHADWTRNLYWSPTAETPTLICALTNPAVYCFMYYPTLNKLIIKDSLQTVSVYVKDELVSSYDPTNLGVNIIPISSYEEV
jgi:hypothetical protein